MQSIPNHFGAGLALTFSTFVKGRDFFEGESERDHLGRFRSPPGTTTTTLLERGDVISGFSLIRPGLDLFLIDRLTVDRLILVHGIIV